MSGSEPIPETDTRIARDESDVPAKHRAVLELHDQKLTQVAIAQRVGLSQPQVSRIIREYDDTGFLAAKLANNRRLRNARAAFDGAEKAALNGKPEWAIQIAQAQGVIPIPARDDGPKIQIAMVNMPGQQKYKAEDIPVNVIANYQTPALEPSADSLCKAPLTEGESGE